MASPLSYANYRDNYREWRIKGVSFQIIYPGEQEVPLLSVEMGYLPNKNITNAANPTTMLMSMLDDYCLLPIPASHMISGTINL